MEEKINIKGKVSLNKFDGDGNLVYEWSGNNLVTLDGTEVLAKLFMGDIQDQIRKVKIGYSTVPPKMADTSASLLALTPPNDPITCTSSGWNKENSTVTYDYVSPSGFHMGIWREAGLVSCSGTLFNRIALPEMDKQNDEYVVFSWKLNF